MGRKVENQVGKVYGKLTIISEHSKTRNGHYRYTCKCECGEEKNILLTHLRQGTIKNCGVCERLLGKAHPQWEGVGDISGNFWYNHIVRSAKGAKGRRRELELSIDKEYAWSLFIEQGRKCSLTGIELSFPTKWDSSGYTASLDRIDSSLGYIEGNVQWVHKDVNMMKRTYSQDYFIGMCKKVAERWK